MCLPTQLMKAHAKPHSQRPQSNMSYKAGQVMKIMISMRREGIPRPLRGATAVIFFIGGVSGVIKTPRSALQGGPSRKSIFASKKLFFETNFECSFGGGDSEKIGALNVGDIDSSILLCVYT